MFAYCTECLHLSEAEAYLRITVARASREHPVLLAMLADGRLHLSGIARLAPHLTPANQDELLRLATHKSKRQILELIADLAPRPDAPTAARKLPEHRPSGLSSSQLCPDPVHPIGLERVVPGPSGGPSMHIASPVGGPTVVTGVPSVSAGASTVELRPDRVGHAPSGPDSVEPLGGARYKVQFTASVRLRDKLERLRALMRPEVPDGALAAIIERAVTDKIEQIERRRHGMTDRPRSGTMRTDSPPASRHIPAAVRRAVHERDGDRCGFVSASGHRCNEPDALEYHHRHPFAMGGSHDPGNLALLCRTHNSWLAELDYGRDAMRTARGRGRGA